MVRDARLRARVALALGHHQRGLLLLLLWRRPGHGHAHRLLARAGRRRVPDGPHAVGLAGGAHQRQWREQGARGRRARRGARLSGRVGARRRLLLVLAVQVGGRELGRGRATGARRRLLLGRAGQARVGRLVAPYGGQAAHERGVVLEAEWAWVGQEAR